MVTSLEKHTDEMAWWLFCYNIDHSACQLNLAIVYYGNNDSFIQIFQLVEVIWPLILYIMLATLRNVFPAEQVLDCEFKKILKLLVNYIVIVSLS